MIHKQSRETLMVNTLEPDLGRSGAHKWPMTQLAIIRAFSPYLLRSPKMVDSGSVRIDIKVRHMISYYIYTIYRTHISDSVAHLSSFYLRYVPGLPNERYLDRSLDWLLIRPGLWTGLDWTGRVWIDRWFMLFMLAKIWIWIERLQNLFVICRCAFGLLVQLWGIIDAVIVVNQSTLWHLWQLK